MKINWLLSIIAINVWITLSPGKFNVINYCLIELLYNLHSLYIPQLQFLCLNMNVLVFIFCSMIVVINVNRCIGSSGNLETKLFRKVTVRYTDADVLDIYLKLKTVIQALTPGIISPNCPAVVLQYQEWYSVVCIATQTVSALPSHSFRMTKLVRWKNWLGILIVNCKKFNRILFLLYRLEAVFLGIWLCQKETTHQ